MLIRSILAALMAVVLGVYQGSATTLLPPGNQCFQATAGLNGMVGLLGSITGGSSYTNGTYGGVALTGGSGINATANITVSGGAVTAVTILNPGIQYVVGDIFSATAANIGGTGSGFAVPVASTSINSSLAGGSVGYFIPNTQTPKQTWQDSGQSAMNTNPVNLDANGCATVYGTGIYRQIVKDSLGNTVWDKLTAATDSTSPFYAGVAAGTGNAITIVDTSFSMQDGSLIQFLANATNTGAATISVSGGTAISIVQDTSTGPASLVAGQIAQGNVPLLEYDAVNAIFHLLNPAVASTTTTATSLVYPQGYLNLVGQASGDVIQTGDVLGTGTIFYSPFVGNQIPIWNGSLFQVTTFSELTATLTSSGSPSDTIQDTCVFSNNGTPTLVIGPSWTTVTVNPGASARGSGAGTAQIVRLQGLWVNANAITAYNGLTSYSIPANRCTYVGSLYIDHTAGQITAHRTYGQNRKFGPWNAYNRQPIYLKAGDSATSWNYTTATIRASNAAPASFTSVTCNVGGATCNSVMVFQGLPEEVYNVNLIQSNANTAAGPITQMGVGWNSITAFSGTIGQRTALASGFSDTGTSISSQYLVPPSLGINAAISLEESGASGTTTWYGTETKMSLSAWWRG